jgi:hypothetical protein
MCIVLGPARYCFSLSPTMPSHWSLFFILSTRVRPIYMLKISPVSKKWEPFGVATTAPPTLRKVACSSSDRWNYFPFFSRPNIHTKNAWGEEHCFSLLCSLAFCLSFFTLRNNAFALPLPAVSGLCLYRPLCKSLYLSLFATNVTIVIRNVN